MSSAGNKFHIDNRKMDMCFVDHKRKIIFINIPKNGSTSIRNTLNLEYEKFRDLEGYVKFTVLRNPVDRIVSSWNEIRKCRKDGPYFITRNMVWFKETNEEKSFNLFLKEMEKGNFYDGHSFPQIKSLRDKNIKIEDLDHVIKFETLSEEFKKIFGKDIRHHNKKQTDLMDYIETNPKVFDRIIKVYQEDYLLWKENTESTDAL